ncbi:MAG: histidine phosphatase family protein [Anaerolineae bacterium]
MRLYFIRHGQSANNALGAIPNEDFERLRSYDPELTEIGVQQAELAGQFLKDGVDMPHEESEPFSFTHLYVSPMIRALNTAFPIAEALNIDPEVWPDIHEIGGLFTAEGEQVTGYPGLNCNDFAARYPRYHLPETVTEKGWWDINHGRERPEQFMARAIKVAIALRKRAHTDERVALVAHAAFLDALIKALLNQLPTHPNTLFYNHYNTGITRIDFAESRYSTSPEHIRIHYLNRVDHLPTQLWTW